MGIADRGYMHAGGMVVEVWGHARRWTITTWIIVLCCGVWFVTGSSLLRWSAPICNGTPRLVLQNPKRGWWNLAQRGQGQVVKGARSLEILPRTTS